MFFPVSFYFKPKSSSSKTSLFSVGSFFFFSLFLLNVLLPLIIPSFLDVFWTKTIPQYVHPTSVFNGEFMAVLHHSDNTVSYSSSSPILNDFLSTSFVPYYLQSSPSSLSLNISFTTEIPVNRVSLIFGSSVSVDTPFLKGSLVQPVFLSCDASTAVKNCYFGGSGSLFQNVIPATSKFNGFSKLCSYPGLELLCSSEPVIKSLDVNSVISALMNLPLYLRLESTEFVIPSVSTSEVTITSFFNLHDSFVYTVPTFSQSVLMAVVPYFVYFVLLRFVFSIVFRKFVAAGYVNIIKSH
ncbi:hypothetical protein RCL1_005530 [Eukaryota sp. TZLM3-RCL]